jgi:hypothetical protein
LSAPTYGGAPGHRRPQVAALVVQPRQPRQLAGAFHRGFGLLGEPQVVRRVPRTGRGLLAALREALPRVLAHRLQHREAGRRAGLQAADQAVLDEGGEAGERLDPQVAVPAAHGRDGLERPAAREHRQPAEQPLERWVEQVVAPRQRRAQAPVPFRLVARPVGQQVQPVLESLLDDLRCQDGGPGGGQLAEQGVLGDQLRLAPHQVGRSVQDERAGRGGAERAPQAATQRPDSGVGEVVDAVQGGREHRLFYGAWWRDGRVYGALRAPGQERAHVDGAGSQHS